MTVVVSSGFRWIAERDRVAHAHRLHGPVTRTLCGLPAIDERYGHPPAVRCPRCTKVAQEHS